MGDKFGNFMKGVLSDMRETMCTSSEGQKHREILL